MLILLSFHITHFLTTILAFYSLNYSIWVQILSFALFLMTDANLFMPLTTQVMPCIEYILNDLFVEQNDLQFAYLSGRVTTLSSTTASGSFGVIFLFRASSMDACFYQHALPVTPPMQDAKRPSIVLVAADRCESC